MSPDVGRTENQKHKQYKLVLKSSELDRLLLPRLLCFRSSRPRASPGTPGRGVVSVAVRSHIWLHSCTGHPVHMLLLSSRTSVLGRGFENCGVLTEPWWERGAAGGGRQRRTEPRVSPRARFTSSGFGSAKAVQVLLHSGQAGAWCRFWCERCLEI